MGTFICCWFCAPLDVWPCHKDLTGLAPHDTVAECQVLYVLFIIVFPCQWNGKQLSVCRIILRAVIDLVPLRKKVTLICSIKILHMFCISNILCKIIALLYYSAQMTGQLYLSYLWNEINWVSSNFAFIYLGGVSISDQRVLYTWTSLSCSQHGCVLEVKCVCLWSMWRVSGVYVVCMYVYSICVWCI